MILPPLARDLLEALPEPALLVRAQRLIAFNTAARTLFGSQPAGTDIRLIIRQPQALGAILSGAASELEVTGIGGVDRSWAISLRPVDAGALLVRLVDVSAARAAEKARVDFVANASHELRTPLATVLGYAETLREDDLPSELRERFAGAVLHEARRMLRVVEDLMSLSRIEADRFVPPAGRIDPAILLKTAAAHAGVLAEQRGCHIRLEAAEDLPVIPGDPGLLGQVLDNLLANAVRYGGSPERPEILLSAKVEGRHLLLSVRDQGEGIPPEHLPRVTQRFYRVDEARSRDTGGTGLGLAIVKHIVERHRGTLDIRSRVGAGTEVSVRLPLG
jgi:two-component system phosphate regulon sensor histidine kinase PhoR